MQHKDGDELTEIETKKEYLKSYRNICYKIKALQDQKYSLIETMTSAKAQNYDGMPTSSSIGDLSDYMVKLDAVMRSIDNMNAMCLARKIQIESSIANMADGIECNVLHKRYIMFKSWEVIAIETGYCVKQVQRIHGKALQHFDIGGSVHEKE